MLALAIFTRPEIVLIVNGEATVSKVAGVVVISFVIVNSEYAIKSK